MTPSHPWLEFLLTSHMPLCQQTALALWETPQPSGITALLGSAKGVCGGEKRCRTHTWCGICSHCPLPVFDTGYDKLRAEVLPIAVEVEDPQLVEVVEVVEVGGRVQVPREEKEQVWQQVWQQRHQQRSHQRQHQL